MILSFLYPSVLFALFLVPALLALPFVGRAASTRNFNFWAAVGLRALVLLALVLGLAGTQIVQAVHDMTVVFVVDHSASVPQAEQKRAEEFIRASLGALKPGDRAAVVVFGENALVERLASDDSTLEPINSIPRTGHTDIASALRLALALFPEDTQKRIVLLSDGLENVGRAEDVMELAAARGVEIDAVPLAAPTGQAEAYLDSLEAPASVRKGQSLEIVAVVQSTASGTATVRLFGDGRLLGSREVTLQTGTNRVGFSLIADQVGFRRYTAELDAAKDTLRQNNTASAFTLVTGAPRVLVVGANDDTQNLTAALQAANIESERVAPSALPGDLAALSNYDTVFLVNVPASALSDPAMNALPAYVRDLGRGLVMIGGSDAYGAGGYLRTPLEKALPVDMDVRSQSQEPNLAMVFVIDKSGSMGRCHCDDPNAQPGTYQRVESGLAKVDIAKDAIMQAARGIGPADYVGVLVFDANALWAVRLQQLDEPSVIQQKIGGIRAEGSTNIYAGLNEAESALRGVNARFKHVILMTDGWSRSGDFDALGQKMKSEGITLSVVAEGNGSATWLQQLAQRGGGNYYAARDLTQVPQLFFKETVQATGRYIVEQPFYPAPSATTPILRGLDVTQLPALRGYNGTTPKATAQVSLVSDQGDPILATWQYGLGRAVAWTSDVKGQWASDWVNWDGLNKFVAQLTNWVLPQPQDVGAQMAFRFEGAQTTLDLTSTDSSGRPRDLLETRATIIGPDASSQTIALTQVAPGLYRAQFAAAQPGVYLARVTQYKGASSDPTQPNNEGGTPVVSATGGLVVPYSPEYKFAGGLVTVLPELTRATGGKEFSDPSLAFAPLAQPATRTQPLWPSLLLLAALLFPFDVAARRLRLSRVEGQQLLAWTRVRVPHRGAVGGTRALDALFAARARARARQTPAAKPASPAPRSFPSPVEQTRAGPPRSESPAAPTSGDELTERLKKARDRAHRPRV